MTDKTKEPDDGYFQKFFNYHTGFVSLPDGESDSEPLAEADEAAVESDSVGDSSPTTEPVDEPVEVDDMVDAVTKQRMAQMLRKSRGISLAEAEGLLNSDKELFDKVYNSRTWH